MTDSEYLEFSKWWQIGLIITFAALLVALVVFGVCASYGLLPMQSEGRMIHKDGK